MGLLGTQSKSNLGKTRFDTALLSLLFFNLPGLWSGRPGVSQLLPFFALLIIANVLSSQYAYLTKASDDDFECHENIRYLRQQFRMPE